MPRSRKSSPTEHAENPLPKSRKKALAALKEDPAITTAAELEPPEREVTPPPPPSDNRHRPGPPPPLNGTDRETEANFVEKVRPTGPRPRKGEPAASFASDDLRIVKDDQTWQMVARRDLTGDERDFAARQGMTPVDDEERVWNGSVSDIRRAEGDVNALAYRLGKHPDGRGR